MGSVPLYQPLIRIDDDFAEILLLVLVLRPSKSARRSFEHALQDERRGRWVSGSAGREMCVLELELDLEPTIQRPSKGAGLLDEPRHWHPPPGPELAIRRQGQHGFLITEPQRVPVKHLAEPGPGGLPFGWQLIHQRLRQPDQQLELVWPQSGFFGHFPEKRFLGGLAYFPTALRQLPRAGNPCAFEREDIPVPVDNHGSHTGPKVARWNIHGLFMPDASEFAARLRRCSET